MGYKISLELCARHTEAVLCHTRHGSSNLKDKGMISSRTILTILEIHCFWAQEDLVRIYIKYTPAIVGTLGNLEIFTTEK